MKEFFKKYWWILLLVFTISIGISYIWFVSPLSLPNSNINKEYWLSFWGSFLSFSGTVFLGLVALWQNEKANDLNNQLIKIEEKKRIEAMMPILKLRKLIIDDNHSDHSYSCEESHFKYSLSEEELYTSNASRFYIKIEFENISNSTCFDLIINRINVIEDVEQHLFLGNQLLEQNKNSDIAPKNNFKVTFFVTEEFMTKFRQGNFKVLEMEIEMANYLGVKYIETLRFGKGARYFGCWQTSQIIMNDCFEFKSCFKISPKGE